MAQGVFANHEDLRLLPYAFGSAIATAGYTLSDGIGARISESATSYIAWLFILTVPFFITSAILLKGFIVIKIPMKTRALCRIAINSESLKGNAKSLLKFSIPAKLPRWNPVQ